MSDPSNQPTDRRWPQWVYGTGEEPDARFSFANERTFLAWVRTGLAFLTAGVAIVALDQLRPEMSVETHIAALLLILLGIACALNAFYRWARNERALRRNRPLPSSIIAPVLVGGLVVVGLVALPILLP